MEELLIIVDMVNGFVKVGSLADSKIGLIIPKQIKLIKDFIEKKQQIIFIKDSHTKDSIEFKTFPPHCIKGTKEAEIVDELKPYTKYALEYEKNSTSTIYAPGFMENIKKYKKLKRVVITGCCTDICILNLALPLKNYFNQNNLDIEILIYKDTVETFDSPNHNKDTYNKMAFKLMENAGITLVKKL